MTTQNENKRRRVYILRGISGSGKSTHARVLAAQEHERAGRIVKIEQVNTDGLDPAADAHAHAYCMRKFEAAISEDTEVVICDHTNITPEEFEAFATLAQEHLYTVHVVTVYRDPVVCYEKRRRDVSPQVLFDQYLRLLATEVPQRWNPETVFHH